MKELNKIGYLGPKGTFTHIAATKFSGTNQDSLVSYSAIGDVYDALVTGNVAHIVVPIENSSKGFVPASLQQLLRHHKTLHVLASDFIDVTFSLYSRMESVNQINKVIGHPMALKQTSEWLARHQLEGEEVSSSAVGLKKLATEKVANGVGAVGPPDIGELFGLHELEKHLEGAAPNQTRFLQLSVANKPKSGKVVCVVTSNICAVISKISAKGYDISDCLAVSEKRNGTLGSYTYYAEIKLSKIVSFSEMLRIFSDDGAVVIGLYSG